RATHGDLQEIERGRGFAAIVIVERGGRDCKLPLAKRAKMGEQTRRRAQETPTPLSDLRGVVDLIGKDRALDAFDLADPHAGVQLAVAGTLAEVLATAELLDIDLLALL